VHRPRNRIEFTEPTGECCNSRAEIDIVDAHDKADCITVRAAAEAVKKPLVVADRKRRGFLAVKWAQPDQLPAGAL
jgi:hypothetical protein